MVAVEEIESTELPPLQPPEGFPPYRQDACRCHRLSVSVRDKVERSSHSLLEQVKEEKRRQNATELPDKWYRCRIYGEESAPMNLLHRHYAGMGGRSMMGEGVGGFCLGAACPSGGLVTIAAVTYDLPWFTCLLNTYLRDTQRRDQADEVAHVECQMPDVFSCWQLNFGRNDSQMMSDTCFYNPHVDKNNAKVSSIGTSFGDYEGGGVWVAHPEGNTTVNFERELDGIYKGYVPGVVLSQKVRWLSFWAATKVHAIPPFRKNRIGMVAFSSQTAIRCTPEERRIMDILQFVMPSETDTRFVPVLPEVLQVPKSELYKLTREQLKARAEAQKEYGLRFQEYQKECDKIKIAIACECHAINRNRILGVPIKLPDGTVGVTVTGKIAADELVQDYEKAHNNDVIRMEKEAEKCIEMLEKLETLSNKLAADTNEENKIILREMWSNLNDTFQKVISVGTRAGDSDTELVEYLGKNSTLMSGVKEDMVVSLFPTRPKCENLPRKDRKKMEQGRWKHKLKYGTLPPEMEQPNAATQSSSSSLKEEKGSSSVSPVKEPPSAFTKEAVAKESEKSSSSTKDSEKSSSSSKDSSPGSSLSSHNIKVEKQQDKKRLNNNNNNNNKNRLNNTNIGTSSTSPMVVNTGEEDIKVKVKSPLSNGVVSSNTNERINMTKKELLNAAAAAEAVRPSSDGSELNGRGKNYVSSTTTTAQNTVTAAAILMAAHSSNTRKAPEIPSPESCMSELIYIDSESDDETTRADSLISGAPFLKRSRETDFVGGGEAAKKLRKLMGGLLCQPFFPGEVVGLD